jgi:hypothetical protein
MTSPRRAKPVPKNKIIKYYSSTRQLRTRAPSDGKNILAIPRHPENAVTAVRNDK